MMVALNALSSTGAIGNQIGDVSDTHPTYFTPASSAFSIWGLIYALMALYILYQALPVDWPVQKNTKMLYEDIGWLFVTMAVLNSLWIVVFAQSSVTDPIGSGSDAYTMWIAAVIIALLLTNNLWIHAIVNQNREECNT